MANRTLRQAALFGAQPSPGEYSIRLTPRPAGRGSDQGAAEVAALVTDRRGDRGDIGVGLSVINCVAGAAENIVLMISAGTTSGILTDQAMRNWLAPQRGQLVPDGHR